MYNSEYEEKNGKARNTNRLSNIILQAEHISSLKQKQQNKTENPKESILQLYMKKQNIKTFIYKLYIYILLKSFFHQFTDCLFG